MGITIYSGGIEINLIGHGKKCYLYLDPPNYKKYEFEREDIAFFIQLLNIIESDMQDLIMYLSTVKGMWNYLDELFSIFEFLIVRRYFEVKG